MKFSTIRRMAVLGVVNHLLAGTRYFAAKRNLLRSVGYALGEGTKVVGPIHCSGTLVTGENCWIGRGVTIHGNGTVVLGDNCDIAPEVAFLTGGHEIGDSGRRAGKGEIYTVTVGSGTWIGARATLGRNIRVGRGCVIAACACVMEDVADNRMVAGVPAREIRTLEDDADAGK